MCGSRSSDEVPGVIVSRTFVRTLSKSPLGSLILMGDRMGADTFQLFPGDSHMSGSTTMAQPRYWACSGSNGPMDANTHASSNVQLI